MAALIDAGTGYGTVADWVDASPQPDSADSGASLVSPYRNIIPAETGYDTVADWFDNTPQPDSAASGASLRQFIPGVIEGRLIDTGGGGSREMWGIVGG